MPPCARACCSSAANTTRPSPRPRCDARHAMPRMRHACVGSRESGRGSWKMLPTATSSSPWRTAKWPADDSPSRGYWLAVMGFSGRSRAWRTGWMALLVTCCALAPPATARGGAAAGGVLLPLPLLLRWCLPDRRPFTLRGRLALRLDSSSLNASVSRASHTSAAAKCRSARRMSHFQRGGTATCVKCGCATSPVRWDLYRLWASRNSWPLSRRSCTRISPSGAGTVSP